MSRHLSRLIVMPLAATLYFVFVSNLLAAPVGNPVGLDEPSWGLFSKERAIEQELDKWEEIDLALRISGDVEFLFDKALKTSSETTKAEIEGLWSGVKLALNVNKRIEPYVRLGAADFDAKWFQNNQDIKANSETGFFWGVGCKVLLWRMKEEDIDFIVDGQYRQMDSEVERGRIGTRSIRPVASGEFDVREWQLALLASKKFALPVFQTDLHLTPYTGLTLSNSTMDVHFKESGSDLEYSLYKGNNKHKVGLLLGCDILPAEYFNQFTLNLELRLVDETALTLGGTIKF